MAAAIPTVTIKGKDAGPAMVHQVAARMNPALIGGIDTASKRLGEVVVAHASGRPGPNIRTRRLVDSVHVNAARQSGTRFTGTVVVGARSDKGFPYPAYLEGHGFPFLGPAIAVFRAEYRAIMAAAVRRGVQR